MDRNDIVLDKEEDEQEEASDDRRKAYKTLPDLSCNGETHVSTFTEAHVQLSTKRMLR